MTYSTQFNQAVARTLRDEGVLSDRPSDLGGLTKYGITIPFYSDYLGRQATKADILALTPEKAIDVYHTMIWQRRHIGEIADEQFQAQAFDFAVNSGGAILVIQGLVGATIDGNIGPATQGAIAAYVAKHGSRKAANDLVLARGRYLMDLAKNDPDHSLASLKGWYNRVVGRLDFAY